MEKSIGADWLVSAGAGWAAWDLEASVCGGKGSAVGRGALDGDGGGVRLSGCGADEGVILASTALCGK